MLGLGSEAIFADILPENQISPKYIIENNTTLAILLISNGYHNFSRFSQSLNMLEIPQLLELQKNLCYKAIFKTIPNPSP